MDTVEPQASSTGQDSAPPALDTTVAPPERWSARARQRLAWAKIIGFGITLIGTGLFVGQTSLTSTGDMLKMLIGLYSIPLGVGLIYLAVGTQSAAPDQLYQPGSLQGPRRWFVLVWAIGIIPSVALKAQRLSDLKPLSAVALGLSIGIALCGGLWCWRWLSAKMLEEWPAGRMDAPAALPMRWPRAWTIAWSTLGGVVSIVLAFGLEVLGIWLVTPLIRPALNRAAQSITTPASLTLNLLSDPTIALLVFVGFAVIAPLIEELCKALSLRMFRNEIQRPIDGLLLGMAAGLGFGLLESALYLTGLMTLWLIAVWLRLATLLMHGLATSIVGLAYARSRQTGDRRALLAGYARAVLLHGVWNAVALGLALQFLNDQLLLGLIGMMVLLVLIVRVLPRTATAGVQTAVQEGYAQADQPLPPEWSPMEYGVGWRLVGGRPIHWRD